MSHCDHKREDTWELTDAQGIYCARVCDKCEAEVMSHYRPEIFSGYDQSDVDEPIEPDYDSAPGCWGEDAPFYSGLG